MVPTAIPVRFPEVRTMFTSAETTPYLSLPTELITETVLGDPKIPFPAPISIIPADTTVGLDPTSKVYRTVIPAVQQQSPPTAGHFVPSLSDSLPPNGPAIAMRSEPGASTRAALTSDKPDT